MKFTGRKILLLAGIASTGLGIAVLIPAYLKEYLVIAVAGTVFFVTGLIIIAIAYDEDYHEL